MPVIRISDATWKRLERHALGFDTPERVVLRALDALEAGNPTKEMASPPLPLVKERVKHTRERTIGITGLRRNKYRIPLLETVFEFGGEAPLDRVHAILARRMESELETSDRKRVPSMDEPRWWNDVKWLRNDLVKEGLFRNDSKRGVWELTEAGVKAVETIRRGG